MAKNLNFDYQKSKYYGNDLKNAEKSEKNVHFWKKYSIFQVDMQKNTSMFQKAGKNFRQMAISLISLNNLISYSYILSTELRQQAL